MRLILFSFLILPFISHSQDCSQYTTEIKDEVEGISIFSGKGTVLFKTKTSPEITFEVITVLTRGNKGLALVFAKDGFPRSVRTADQIKILFEDGTRLSLNNNSENYKGQWALYFGGPFGKLEEIKSFIDKKIKIVRLTYSEESFDVYPSGDAALLLQNQLSCLFKNLDK